jgi:alpha-1,2-mannosyltransferase
MPPAAAGMTRERLALAAIVCGAFGTYGWAIFGASFSHDGALGPHYNAPGADWTVFHTAARAYFEGNLPLLFDGNRLTDELNTRFADWLSGPLPYHPWLYPPHYLLLLLPFGLLPFGLSYVAFVTATLAGLCAAIWSFAPDARAARRQLASLLLCPAASLTVAAGQNAFLTAALLLGGFRLIDRFPVAGGVLLGVLTFKPQFWLMVPIALIADRRWRALAAAAATAAAMVFASGALFGVDVWQGWLETAVAPPGAVYEAWLEAGRMAGQSVYTCAQVLGAGDAVGNVAQSAAALLAAAVVWWAFRRPLGREERLIVLLSATLLAAPHVSGYDTVFLAIAAGLLACRATAQGLPFPRVILAMAMWLLPPFAEPRTNPLMVLLPLLIAAFIATAIVSAPGKLRPATATAR